MNMLALVAPVLGIVALLFARSLSVKVSKQDAGTDRMKEIAAFIHEGAQAFLMAEYKILVVFVAVLFVCRRFWLTVFLTSGMGNLRIILIPVESQIMPVVILFIMQRVVIHLSL